MVVAASGTGLAYGGTDQGYGATRQRRGYRYALEPCRQYQHWYAPTPTGPTHRAVLTERRVLRRLVLAVGGTVWQYAACGTDRGCAAAVLTLAMLLRAVLYRLLVCGYAVP
eukprot:277529-Rhodomonas_salina.2